MGSNGGKHGAAGILAAMGAKKATDCLTDEQAAAYQAYQDACDYFRFVVNRRLSKNIASTLKEAPSDAGNRPLQAGFDGFG